MRISRILDQLLGRLFRPMLALKRATGILATARATARAPWAAAAAVAARPAAAPAPVAPAAGRLFCTFPVSFLSADGNTVSEVTGKSGQTILEVAHEHDIDIEGACGGECACSTCHVILDQAAFDALPEPDDDEADMLDLAAHVCDTSRLGCQVKLQKGRDDGIRVHLPQGSINLLS